jgi:hypothetical protein
MKIHKLYLATVTVALLSGCAYEYTPKTTKPLDEIHEFSSRNSVNLINGQPSTDRVYFFRHHLYGDLHKWTDAAITIADRELSKRGMTCKPDASKSLTLSIESANTSVGWVTINSDVTMIVRASNGYTKTYSSNDFSVMMGNPRTEMDTAVTKLVAAMLNDPQLVAFLTK